MPLPPSKPRKPVRSPGQRRYEESNPWSRNPSHNGQFFWENQTDAVRKVWDEAAAQAAQQRRSRRTLHFASPTSTTPTNGAPVVVPEAQRVAVARIIQGGPRSR